MTGPTVFISYSHQDEAWKDQLVRQLKVLELEGDLTVWEDRQIAAGDGWRGEIETAMERAQVAVLLISADFLTSRFMRTWNGRGCAGTRGRSRRCGSMLRGRGNWCG